MTVSASFRHRSVMVICYLYAFLFTYAAVSKLLDFATFRIQLGQSPLLSPFAHYLVFAVPVLELLIAVTLFVERFRLLALTASFTLMALFTSYIYIVLHYSSYVPCSCGGILQKMSWSQHLLFNIFFLLLATISILFVPLTPAKNYERHEK